LSVSRRDTSLVAAPEKQLKSFIAKFDAKNQALIRRIRKALRARIPTATELAYDNYNFFVIGYAPSERPSDAILSIAAGASGVGLCFIQGAKLPDPHRVLLGSGKQTRFVRLPTVAVLDEPAVAELIAAAIKRSPVPFPPTGRGKLVIRAISKHQRPRQSGRR
jgi:hypothetical protein